MCFASLLPNFFRFGMMMTVSLSRRVIKEWTYIVLIMISLRSINQHYHILVYACSCNNDQTSVFLLWMNKKVLKSDFEIKVCRFNFFYSDNNYQIFKVNFDTLVNRIKMAMDCVPSAAKIWFLNESFLFFFFFFKNCWTFLRNSLK